MVSRSCSLSQGNVYVEVHLVIRFPLDTDVAAQLMHDLICDPQAKAVSAFTQSGEGFEQACDLFIRQCLAVVCHGELQLMVCDTNVKADLALLRCRLNLS